MLRRAAMRTGIAGPRSAIAILVVVALASCGAAKQQSSTPLPTPARWCPAGTERFDGSILLGRGLSSARRLARRHGCSVREVKVDGDDQVITAEFDPKRIDVETRDATITAVVHIG